jgi:ABC-type branched-subunit amino acid transport system ATPase component
VATAADAAIARLDLGDHVRTRPQSLSYGTQRRVEIARALAGEPRVLLLDEPVAGMNREERDQIAAIISSLRADGLSQILIEHDLRMIIDLCDEMLVLNFGREIAAGRPRETAADPAVRVAYLGDRHVAA